MNNLERRISGYTFRLVSIQADNIRMQDIPTHLWAGSLTIAIMDMPDGDSLSDLLGLVSFRLSDDGFFGWVISENPPKGFSGFRILAKAESENAPADAILTLSLSFRIQLPGSMGSL